MVDIGFDARIPGIASDPDSLIRVVTEGERMGYDYTTFSDHLVAPRSIEATYPYKSDGKWMSIAADGRHDALTVIAFLAAKTTRLRFVTSVMVVPYRPPVLTAKMLTSIDVLSGGRLTVGVGSGWMKDEFAALGAPDFAARGKVTDEYLAMMMALWTEKDPRFTGDYAAIDNVEFEPKPVQQPHPPLWIGGLSRPAIRRVARYGNAWYPVPTDQKYPMDSLPRLRTGIAKMRAAVTEAGRNPDDVTVAMRVHEFGTTLPATAGDGERRLFSGKESDIAEDLAAVTELGVSSIDFRFMGTTADEVLDDMNRFRTTVTTPA